MNSPSTGMSAITMESIVLRGATQADWESIARLLVESSLPLAGASEYVDFVVASRGDVIVGCAGVERHGDSGLLRSVAVAESERSQGTGAKLVQRCIEEAFANGISTLVLLTTTAETYFPRFGFETITRDVVPDAIKSSVEFREACPASATVMRLSVSPFSGLLVRPARKEDASEIAEIYNAGIAARLATFETQERSTADVEKWFDDVRYPVLVAERESRVVGWIAASSYRARQCYAGIAEFSVYVAPVEQGKGVGDGLMSEFLSTLEAAQFWKVLSRVFPENHASRRLCRRHGFREVGVYARHAQLDGVWRDVVIVERLLGEAALPHE